MADKQPARQTYIGTHIQTERQSATHTCMQTNIHRQTDMQPASQSGTEPGIHTYMQADIHTRIPIDRATQRQADTNIQTGKQDRMAAIQTYIHIYIQAY